MSASLPIHGRVTPRQLLMLVLVGLGCGWGGATQLLTVSATRELDATLPIAALLALPLPFVALHLYSTPNHPALRRFLGQSTRLILRQTARASTQIAAAWTTSIGVGAMAAGGLTGVGLFSLVLSVGVVTQWAMAMAMNQVAAGDPARWQAMTGGGAFGPAATAPLLYAPAFGFTVGLGVPVLGWTILAGIAKGTGADPALIEAVSATPWAAGIVLATWGWMMWRTRVLLRSLNARAAILRVEAAHEQGFYRSEHLGDPPRLWTIAGSDPGLRALATIWHRRYPASFAVTVVTAGVAAWAMADQTGWSAPAMAACALVVYSGGRAADLLTSRPRAMPTMRFLGAIRPEDSLKKLAIGLSIPATTGLLVAAATDAWLPVLCGLVCGYGLVFALPLAQLGVVAKVAAGVLAVAVSAPGSWP